MVKMCSPEKVKNFVVDPPLEVQNGFLSREGKLGDWKHHVTMYDTNVKSTNAEKFCGFWLGVGYSWDMEVLVQI